MINFVNTKRFLTTVTMMTATLTFALLASSRAQALTTLKAETGKVEFLAIATPGSIKVRGEGAVPQGEMKIEAGKASGEFKIDLASFKTGMDRRDEHMRTALEVEKFPTATIRFQGVEVKEGATKVTIPAELELHGEKKPVALEAELSNGKATGKFRLKLSDFKIVAPKFTIATVRDDVDITIESVLK